MDRDIEQAADAECTCGTTGLTYEGPQRDCPIHGDPIFQAVREAITATIGVFDLDGAKTVSIDELTRAVVAAAVPAIGEQIAAAIADASDEAPYSPRFVAGMDHARLIARSFAAGLSAGAADEKGDK